MKLKQLIIALFTIVFLVCLLAGCGNDKQHSSDEKNKIRITDSLGRQVVLDKPVSRAVVAMPIIQNLSMLLVLLMMLWVWILIFIRIRKGLKINLRKIW